MSNSAPYRQAVFALTRGSMSAKGIVWDSHGDRWNIQYIGAGAEATASLISDPVSEDDSAYKTRTFVLESSGTLVSRTKETRSFRGQRRICLGDRAARI